MNPDGTMTTNYKLRPNITWHDGRPLSTEDFGFAWRVSRDRELPIGARPVAAQITAIDAPDDLTLVLQWGAPFPLADRISSADLGPYPAHLLRQLYESDKDAFQRDVYWSTGFIGVGPYRLTEWTPGSHIVTQVHEGFYGARPKIDTIIFRIITDESTTIANMMAGALDGQLRGLEFEKVVAVKNEMERRGLKPLVVLEPTFHRMIRVQHDPRINGGVGPWPPEITDVRVRRGLLHAIDRDMMVESVYLGYTTAAAIPLPTDDPKYEWVKDAIVRYPYNPRRALELLAEAGWQRAPDGTIRNAAGERVSLQHKTSQGGQWEAVQAITADAWRSLGLEVEEQVIPQAARGDRETNSQYRSFNGSVVAFNTLTYMRQFLISECPSAANRWVGTNAGCYGDPEMDRVSEALHTTVNPTEQQRLWRQWAQLFTRDLPALPLYYHLSGSAFREGFTGFKGYARDGGGGSAWNVEEWDLR